MTLILFFKGDVETGQKLCRLKGNKLQKHKQIKNKDKAVGHTGHVTSLALSSDGRFLASGGVDKEIKIWDTRTNSYIESFKGHRDVVTGLVFQHGTSMLYSSSADRTVKVWNAAEMGYIDTLFGHQSEVMCIDALSRERAVSGGRDKSCRWWKVLEETQLLFQGGHSNCNSVDCISMLNHDAFVSGGDDGQLCLWNTQKKKPLAVVGAAHTSSQNWISGLRAVPYSDFVLSGSSDGFLRGWEADLVSPTPQRLRGVFSYPILGHINSIVTSKSGKLAVLGVGQEHKFGRWSPIKEASNVVVVLSFPGLFQTF